MVETTIMSVAEPVVSNVVFKIRLEDKIDSLPSCVDEGEDVVFHKNFCVLKLPPLTLVIFLKSGHINVTGVKNFGAVQAALDRFNSVFDRKIPLSLIQVVSSTASGVVGGRVDFRKLWETSVKSTSSEFKFSFRRKTFPGVVIRRKKEDGRKKNGGCVQLFTNGKYNILGCKTESDLRTRYDSLCAIITACTAS
jgi:TATA-box binding protein (TBP) (component of TFIID and TFIIIB)